MFSFFVVVMPTQVKNRCPVSGTLSSSCFFVGLLLSWLFLFFSLIARRHFGRKKTARARIISLAQAVYLFIAVEKLSLFFLHLLYSFIAFSAVLFQ